MNLENMKPLNNKIVIGNLKRMIYSSIKKFFSVGGINIKNMKKKKY